MNIELHEYFHFRVKALWMQSDDCQRFNRRYICIASLHQFNLENQYCKRIFIKGRQELWVQMKGRFNVNEYPWFQVCKLLQLSNYFISIASSFEKFILKNAVGKSFLIWWLCQVRCFWIPWLVFIVVTSDILSIFFNDGRFLCLDVA